VFTAGSVVQWLRDGLGLIRSSSEVEELAAGAPDSDDVYLVPAFTGLGAPSWDPHARGTICGLTRGTTAAHIARAALESIAFQCADLMAAMQSDSGVPINELRVDGGAAANNLLIQFQADLLQTRVVRPASVETTAKGAAYLAGLASGVWSNTEEIESQWQAGRVFEPQRPASEVQKLQDRWHDALDRSKAWNRA
jgi:glycerol kinase